ncbi:MAG: LysE family translocator [Kiloniellaceae bacterium]
MSAEEWAVFMVIWIAASLPLGPNALNCISTSAAYGVKKGLWSVVGIAAAAAIHMTLAVTGLAAFMGANPFLFEVVRWLGVGYLLWMGVALLRSKGDMRIDSAPKHESALRLTLKAMAISLSNPKAIFAWMAVFSQFIDPAAPLFGQLAVLAPSALGVTVLVYAGYSALGRGIGRFIAKGRRRWFDRIAGSTFIAFAVGLATADLRRN